MQPTRRRLTVRPSKARLTFWAVCLLILGYLTFQGVRAPVATTGDRPGQQATDEPDRDGVRVPPALARPGDPPVVRFGTLTRAAHLVALSGLEMNLYSLAVQGDGWLEPRLFESSSSLREALENGKLDLAMLPLRDAIRIFVSQGERAPRVVAGAASGDEMYLVRKDVPELDFKNLRPVRVAVLEPPCLDIRRALRLDSEGAPAVILRTEDDLGQALASRDVDLALAPEPLASMVAALSGSRVADPQATPGGELGGGAVLVASVDFVRTQADLLDRLVRTHVISAVTVKNDPDTAARRAIAIIERAGLQTPPMIVWQQATRFIHYQPELPTTELQKLLESARTLAEPGAHRELEGLVLPAMLENALRELEQGAAGK